MLVVQLPQLPTVSALDGNTFESVIFCRFISLTGKSREFSQSQRQLLTLFNRSGQRVMSKYLMKAQSRGFIQKIRKSQGLNPDVYIRGDFFISETQDSRRLVRLSNSLWGNRGLLRSWPYQTAWGHGCLPASVILSLATLRLLEESISRKSLCEYLSPLVPRSSFNKAVKFLFDNHLVYGDGERLLIAPDWEQKLELWLETHPACNERQEIGNKRRADEIESNRVRVRKGKLTDAELNQLLAKPCVVMGCKRRNRQQEHFPPRHFLKQLDVTTNRYLVWSICRKHNRMMADFVKTLDSTIAIPPSRLVLKSDIDPMDIYTAAVNRNIQWFYRAFEKRDQVAATRAIRNVIGLWKAIDLIPERPKGKVSTPAPKRREMVGKNPYSPEKSQLPRE